MAVVRRRESHLTDQNSAPSLPASIREQSSDVVSGRAIGVPSICSRARGGRHSPTLS